MNNQRRKEIEEVLNELADLRSRVDALHGEEQDAYDNMPEGLKASERGQASEAAVSALDDALTAFDDIESSLNEAMAWKESTVRVDLFPDTIPKRAKPRVLMHVSDAGQVTFGDPKDFGKPLCKMTCSRCGAESDYLIFENVTEAKRGIPCDTCNPKTK